MSAVLQPALYPLSALHDSVRDVQQGQEKAGPLATLAQPGLTLVHYAQVLRHLYCMYQQVEAVLIEAEHVHQALCPWYPKSYWLEDDLLQLSQQGLVSLRDIEPAHAAYFSIRSRHEFAGGLYALEGSMLNTARLAAQVRTQLGPQVQPALQFLTGYGGDTRKRWLALCMRIEAQLCSEEAISDACCMARAVQQLLGQAPPSKHNLRAV